MKLTRLCPHAITRRCAPPSPRALGRFSPYRRGGGGRYNSSGFEHVFVGERRRDRGSDKMGVTGMHNWIALYREEKARKLDYFGWFRRKGRRGPTEEPSDPAKRHVLTLQFEWGGAVKECSTSFLGSSPGFELALFTLFFLCGEEKNDVMVGPYPLCINCFRMGGGRRAAKVGTAFPKSISKYRVRGVSVS